MKRTKWTPLLLTTVLAAGLLQGCSQNNPEPGTSAANAGSKNAGTNSAAAKPENNLNKTGMPIVKEPIELTFFTGKAPTNSNDFENTLVWKEYAKQTNINVRFQLVPFDSLTEKRNLALANGDYPDAFYSARVPAPDLLKYGQQGVFLKINDLIDEYAPNLKALLDKYPDLRKAITMPDGNIYSIPSFYSPEFLPMLIGTPLWVKKDWLDKLHMPEPTTTEQLYNYLKAVKNTDLNGNGQQDEIPYSGTSISPLIEQLMGAWGVGNRGLGHKFVDTDPASNELRFYRLDPKFKEVLEYVSKLYQEGLIDPETFTQKSDAFLAKAGKQTVGATINPSPVTQFNGENYIGLGALRGPHGDQMYSHIKVPMVWPGAFVITDKNKNPEATLRWIDSFYGDEGATFYFMGQKGVTYDEKPDGTLEYKDEIRNNPDGLTLDQALIKYVTWIGGSYPAYAQQKYFKGSESLPESVEAGKKAEPYWLKELWYYFNFTEDETEFMQSTGKDIETYIKEAEAKFITGDVPFSEWDSYVSKVQSLGVEQYMNVYKTAYERYKNT
ncbi:extracellular solute-binding protein [Paenibacillus beijingensis]|uniref:ABC transporter substrate-binding protein n=1 Tax=Paenibacillus beijingensis TaxID=1126833 RepID=A0A0D5NK73_9BACL|nr:extracellular solute-binding protein [Paenibacillus beijingensis]AJY75631.1 ABC transporter substrate-binding protein [Paenibacillus beijingensis]